MKEVISAAINPGRITGSVILRKILNFPLTNRAASSRRTFLRKEAIIKRNDNGNNQQTRINTVPQNP
jgi:hypothetical protein